VRAEKAFGVQDRQLAREHRPAIRAVRAVALVAEPAHEPVEGAGGALHRPVGRRQGRTEAHARQAGDDQVEGILGAAIVRGRVAERTDDVEKVRERAGVRVHEEQRRGVLVR
jgi:hypothetical protein